ncbi:MAG: hypothetical protein AB8B99_20275 [Phormidesmis sp.]
MLKERLTVAQTATEDQEYPNLLIDIADVYGTELGDLDQTNRLLNEAIARLSTEAKRKRTQWGV